MIDVVVVCPGCGEQFPIGRSSADLDQVQAHVAEHLAAEHLAALAAEQQP